MKIYARLKITSESWIAGIILVLNLVKLAGAVAPCLLVKVWNDFSAIMGELLYETYVGYRMDKRSQLNLSMAIIQT
jgi:hypothetical protein